ncbi:MAG TPA: hypothetical protein PLM14_08150 [Candidatus Hydrogenedentes bacterium]|nr:hypothetical protein [Candidatus Hydrogenedentota bacterium]
MREASQDDEFRRTPDPHKFLPGNKNEFSGTTGFARVPETICRRGFWWSH